LDHAPPPTTSHRPPSPARSSTSPGSPDAPAPAPHAQDQPETRSTPISAPTAVVLSDAERATIRAAVLAMPPLTDEQTEAIVTLITVIRQRRQRHAPPDR
jgi:hypothetical protein